MKPPLMTLAVLVAVFFGLITLPPAQASEPHLVTIPRGMTVTEAAALLKSEHIVRSAFAFSLLVRMVSPSGVRAGAYIFDRPGVIGVAWLLAHGGNAPLSRVTVPEGSSVREIADILATALPAFDRSGFERIARLEEGYLFPETYFFAAATGPEEIVAVMRSMFDEKTKDIAPTRDIVIIASMLEKEARQLETRRVIAGILWKRLERGMPLQVDAVFGYILDRDTFSPSLNDLSINSPYNTYTHTGLPPGPIGNPGLESLDAALHPVETPYWYYLTGADGTMHYARTFAEHVANRKYLK